MTDQFTPSGSPRDELKSTVQGAFLSPPKSIQSLVYMIGMLGFPIVVAWYVLVSLDANMSALRSSVELLGTRIEDKPMGTERATDFAVYICNSLRHELRAGLPEVIDTFAFDIPSSSGGDEYDVWRDELRRTIGAYVRDVVDRHSRFASRFPVVNGDLGQQFIFVQPEGDAQDVTDTQRAKHVSENISELLVRLILDVLDERGWSPSRMLANSDSVDDSMTDNTMKSHGGAKGPEESARRTVVPLEVFLEHAMNAIDRGTTTLRNQMLDELRRGNRRSTQ